MSRFDDYPPEYRQRLDGRRRFAVRGAAVLLLLAGSSLVAAWHYDHLDVLAAGTLAILILFLWAAGWGLRDVYRHVRVIPYFERRVGDIDTFLHGQALARNCRKLDQLAADRGRATLSAFGFYDDLLGEKLVWHAATDGLHTVTALREGVAADPGLVDDAKSVCHDLDKLAHALQQADQQGIRFCLLLREGCCTSGQEWSVRQGTAF